MSEKQPLYKFTNEAFMFLRKNFDQHLEHYNNPDANFDKLLQKNGIRDYLIKTDAYIITPIKLEPPTSKPNLADAQALDFYNSFEGMTPRLASNPQVLSYLNHFHLHEYGIARWPKSEDKKPETIRKHWLSDSADGKSIWYSNISGRTWWIAYMAINAAKSSEGTLTKNQALEKFSEVTEYYNRTMGFTILRNQKILAEFIRALHHEAKGITIDGYRSMAREINREAGARLIDSLDRTVLRELIKRAADHQMSKLEGGGK